MTAELLFAAVDISGLTWRAGTLVVSLFQPLFWAALGVGFILASIHLISMLATRWGDRRASGKSLAFSAAVHLSILVGTISLLPDYRPRVVSAADEPAEPVQVKAVSLSETTPLPSAEIGNTAAWNELQETPEIELTRATREPVELDEPTVTKRPDPRERSPFELPRDDSLPEVMREIPQQVAAADVGAPSAAAAPIPLDATEAEAREDAASAAMTRDRTRPLSNAASERNRDLPTVERVTRGGVDRRSDRYNPDAMVRSLPAPTSETATLARAESNQITRRDGVVPSDLPVDRTGVDQPTQPTAGQPGRPAIPSFNRSRSSVRQPAREMTDPVVPQRSRTPARSRERLPSRPGAAFEQFDLQQPTLRETPQFARADTDALRLDDDSRLPAEYQLRTSDGRLDAARKFGGNEQSERAVERSLKFLSGIQEPAGNWNAAKYGAGRGSEATAGSERPNVGADADAGVTALSVLAYLGSGSTHEQGPYRENVNRALGWLIANQQANGYLGGADAHPITGAYSHAMATFALAEASAMRQASDPRLRGFDDAVTESTTIAPREADFLSEPLKKAVAYSISAQLRDGGWRYEPGQPDGDMSIFGWHLMGLKSAELAGVQIPDSVRSGMVAFLTERALGKSKGLAGYRRSDPVSPAMTAESLFCKQMLGIKRSSGASKEAVDYLLSKPPRLAEENFYYWYYGTLALYQYGGEPWQQWNERVRDLLVSEQKPDGSWAARGLWGQYGGTIYATALATLSLEVYYRYLPLYKAGGRYRESQ